ncbi:uncharacterized protein LOC131619487 [Vicia villosa]|uniref:uncharacterized protein LOC131619487 n=1 Tax=Vicia villosa TaxID=3911 RepID=UPI00273A7B9A|nr:uncharacterized protein LOC131619487 [Vicia villosa]
MQRLLLWNDLRRLAQNLQDPWLVIGDFNNVLTNINRIGGNIVKDSEFKDMEDMMADSGLHAHDTSGNHFTWSNDHHPLKMDLKDQQNVTRPKTHFKFMNHNTINPLFLHCVAEIWNARNEGTSMYKVWWKLKKLQPHMRQLARHMSEGLKDLQNKRDQLKQAKILLATDLTNTQYVAEVKRCKEEILKTMETEEKILGQRAKVSWLKLGDGNNSYFHAIIKGKNKATGITVLEDHVGRTMSEPKDIEAEVLRFYTKLVGTNSNSLLHIDIDAIRKGAQLQHHHVESLTAPVSNLEILQALKSIGENKAPCIDGYTSMFFKTAWPVIGSDIRDVVHEFFNYNRIYRPINRALVTLIPKFPAAKHMKDLRPIACCTTLYKVINTVVDYSQSTFIPDKVIQYNIIIAQELIRGYTRKHISPKCTIQLDSQKAYETLEWQALEDIMREMRYNINGHYSDYLPAKRGLRQGDPISPLLFVIAMEYLHRCLRKLQQNLDFKFHPKCGKLGIVNICFADDLMLFTRGDKISGTLLMSIFKDFSAATGLRATPTKCKVHFGGVSYAKCVIKHIEAVCRSFIWSGGAEITRKAPVAWDKMCEPKNSGYLNITALNEWNVATLGKLTWNIQAKANKLWVKWVNSYYLKNQNFMAWQARAGYSSLMKSLCTCRDLILYTNHWAEAVQSGRYNTTEMYQCLRGERAKVPWRKILYKNLARPRAKFHMWLALTGRISTKCRIQKFGIHTDLLCVFCTKQETIAHLYFGCNWTGSVWTSILQWLGYHRNPAPWHQEQLWLACEVSKKGWRRNILKVAAAECMYAIRYHRNSIIFSKEQIDDQIIGSIKFIVYTRCSSNRLLNPHFDANTLCIE